MAHTARDVMSTDCTCIKEDDSALEAAKMLARLDVGAMPICGDDDRLKGMLTDRDIVVKVLAEGKDPASTTARDLEQGDGKLVWVDADDSIDDVIYTMTANQIRRVPVIEDHRLVGIIAQADIARDEKEKKVGEMVEAISR